MNQMMQPVIDGTATVGARKVDTRRGSHNGDVSQQWFSRGPDERFLSMNALHASVARRRDNAVEEVFEAGRLRIRGSEEHPRSMLALMPDDQPFAPTHHAFGQLCSLAKAPASFLRGQPSWLAGMNLQYGLSSAVRDDAVKIYADREDRTLRAATGKDYGRIYDASLVESIMKFTGDGVSDTHWKVPGVMDWATSTYNPYVDVTSETTTLFASDHDVFVFLVDDTRPIEIGKLANGDPDLIFRGFYASNSEVGTRSLRIASFWLRAVCQNRNLWGLEDFDELRIVHSKYGNDRFIREAEPALERYIASEPTKLVAGIKAAKQAKIAETEEDRLKFLTADSLGFSLKTAQRILETVEREEHTKATSIWDMCAGITAVARTIPETDTRLEMEKTASKLMDRATRHLVGA